MYTAIFFVEHYQTIVDQALIDITDGVAEISTSGIVFVDQLVKAFSENRDHDVSVAEIFFDVDRSVQRCSDL